MHRRDIPAAPLEAQSEMMKMVGTGRQVTWRRCSLVVDIKLQNQRKTTKYQDATEYALCELVQQTPDETNARHHNGTMGFIISRVQLPLGKNSYPVQGRLASKLESHQGHQSLTFSHEVLHLQDA